MCLYTDRQASVLHHHFYFNSLEMFKKKLLTALFQSSFHTWCFLVPQLVGEVTGIHQLGHRRANREKGAHNTLQQL